MIKDLIKKYFSKLDQKQQAGKEEDPLKRHKEQDTNDSRGSYLQKKPRDRLDAIHDMQRKCVQRTIPELQDKHGNVLTNDSLGGNPFNLGQPNVPVALIDWYANRNFLGYPIYGIMAQDWLIDKCCTIPAKDSVRKGFSITKNDGKKIEGAILDEIRRLDIKYKLPNNLIEFVRFSRIYGIRLALFKVNSDDPDYYQNPFNIDGVMPGSYKGISQIDPNWIFPELDGESLRDPSSIHYFEPTWWVVNGQRIHRSHFSISIPSPVTDVLKPTYFYGGIPLTQKIYELVYNAQRTSNEVPLLAMTKRADVIQMDIAQATANQGSVEAQILQWQFLRDNFGTKIIGLDETYQQFDTSLADLDAAIMTQYQLCAAASNIPVSKLLGTSPKGFNTTGEYEEANYHEELESIQCHDLTPMVQKHHQLVIKSDICPMFNCEYFETEVIWSKLDTMTEKELAEVNKLKSENDVLLSQTGALNGEDIRNRNINDPNSGYNGLEELDQEEIDLNLEEESLGGRVIEKIVV